MTVHFDIIFPVVTAAMASILTAIALNLRKARKKRQRRHKKRPPALDTSEYESPTTTRVEKPQVAQKFPYESVLEPKKEYWWCSCGLSDEQPFCNGACVNTDTFKPKLVVVDEKQTVWLCGCKNTKNPPYCDGAHKNM